MKERLVQLFSNVFAHVFAVNHSDQVTNNSVPAKWLLRGKSSYIPVNSAFILPIVMNLLIGSSTPKREIAVDLEMKMAFCLPKSAYVPLIISKEKIEGASFSIASPY